MFCSECGQINEDAAKFCKKCGKKFEAIEKSSSSLEQEKPQDLRDTNQTTSSNNSDNLLCIELKESGTVTVLSVIGLVFGLISLSGSLIPCIGGLAIYIGLPASIISGIALGIAKSQNAKRTFAIVALTISLIGVVISGLQLYSMASFATRQEQKNKEMLNNFLHPQSQAPSQVPSDLPSQSASKIDFTQYWSDKNKQLKNMQYDQFLIDTAPWPINGYAGLSKSKRLFINDCKKYWTKLSWDNPKISKDANNNVWKVQFDNEDLLFEYTVINDKYKLTAIYSNLAGGD